MPEFNKHSVFKKPLLYGFLAFLLVLIITQTITNQRFKIQNQNEQHKVNERALELEEDLQGILGQSSTATQTLAFIVENYGIPDNFDSIAQLLINSNKNIDALELVNKDGVITHVYPLAGNEVLGLNIFKDSIGKDGAITTLERKDYFTAGPIYLNQGGSGFVGRRPLFNDDGFNGFVAAVIKLSTVINAVEIDSLDDPQFYFQLAKINPNKTEEVFYSSKDISKGEAINVPLTTSQGEWKLYVISNQPTSYSTIIIFSVLGFLLSLVCGILVWFLVRQPFRLNQLVLQKTKLLNESNNKLKTLVEQASDGIFLTSSTGVISDVNISGAKMLGYTINELIGINLKDIYDAEELKHNPIKFKELKAGHTILHERKMIRKDDSSFYGEINAKMTPNGHLLGILRDITERKELELIAEDNLQKFSKAFNSGFVGMVIKDDNKRFLDANSYFLDLIGYTLEEVKGKTISELGLLDLEEALKKNPAISAFGSSERVGKIELEFKTKKGEILHLITSMEHYEYQNKKYSLSTYINQTDRKKADLEIRQSEIKYRELTERISDAFIAIDRHWNYTYINARAAKILNIDPKILIGKNVWEEYPDFAKTEAYSFFHDAMKNQTYIKFEQYHPQFDSWIENKLYPSPEGITVYFRDVTKKKKADQENQKLIAIIENSPDFIGLTSLEGNSLYLNEAGKKLVGFSAEKDITETSIADFFPEEYGDDIINKHLTYLHKTGVWSMEVPFKNFKTNKIVPAEFSGFIIRDKISNEPIGIGCIAFDLTEHKRSQHEILDLQTKMDAAIRIGKIGYWDYDIETENANWSPRLYEIYNVKPGTTITIPLLEKLIHPDDVDLHRKVLKETIVENGTHSYTYRIFDNNGSIKYLHIEMEADFNEEDLPVKLRGTVVDITEQKEANNKILELQNKMDAAIRIGKIGYWDWNLENNLVEWSNEMFEIYGIPDKTSITLEEAIEFTHPDDSNVLAEVLSRKQDEDQTIPTIYKICLKDKTVKHILSFNENVYNNEGKPIKLHGTSMDITKSVLAEEALRENKEKFTKAFQTNLMGMIMLDSERKVIEANDVVYKLLGVTREGLIGNTIMESAVAVMENYDDNEREKLWKHFLKHGRVINQKFKINLKSGRKMSLSVSIESLFFNNKQNYLVNLIDDTKRKEAEEALELQNIQLKKTNSELDSFVYSASHELRAPLASVLGLINLILTEENKPSLVTNLNMMEKSIIRLDDFIKDIIEYSRNKHLKVNVETINFTNLIESSIESLWYLENTNKINIEISVNDKVSFVSDSKRISIVLNNFISNAIKYHDIEKKAPSIWLDVTTTKKEAIIIIKDNGLGIEEKEIDNIFNMFYRVSSRIMGSGIGLFIVKEVLTKLNGSMVVESKLGEGSMFTIKIPNESGRK